MTTKGYLVDGTELYVEAIKKLDRFNNYIANAKLVIEKNAYTDRAEAALRLCYDLAGEKL